MRHRSKSSTRFGLACALALALAPLSARATETIPAGTAIDVRLVSGIDSSKAGPNETYLASVADPVVVNNQVAIPRGASATVQLVKTGDGQYAVKLYEVTVNGRPYAVASSYAEAKASNKGKTARRGLIGGGAGAAIGAIAGGGKGAAIGAGIGGGAGAISGLASGKKVQLAPETLLNFQLRAPLLIG